jgi:DNA-binding transcriptional ArsR family regulator
MSVSSLWSGRDFNSCGLNKAKVFYETRRSDPPAIASLLISQQFSKVNAFSYKNKDLHKRRLPFPWARLDTCLVFLIYEQVFNRLFFKERFMSQEEYAETCKRRQVHPESIALVQAADFGEDTARGLAELFRILGESTRVRILQALSCTELCVCDLSELLDMSPSAVSHQLRLLRANKLVRFRRIGKNVFYSLDDEHVESLLQQGTEHIREERS